MSIHVVLGPGRSGSSFLSRELSNSGVIFFGPLREADYFNSEGYYENLLVSGINQALLLTSGSFNGDYLIHLRKLRQLQCAEQDAYKRLLENVPVNIDVGVKCPRFCATFCAWEQMLIECHGDVVVHLCLRNPLHVARSLARQGRPRNFALLWWSSYLLSGISHGAKHELRIFQCEDSELAGATNELEALALDLWDEVKRTAAVSTPIRNALYQVFEQNADWLPTAAAVERSLAAINTAAGENAPIGISIKSAFPEFSTLWAIREDYATTDVLGAT